MNFRLLVFFFLGALPALFAQTPPGRISGALADRSGGAVPAGTTVTLRAEGAPARTTTTDAQGRFVFEGVAAGSYMLAHGGAAETPVTVSAGSNGTNAVDVGRLTTAAGDAPIQMERFEIAARQEAFYNSIDRKVYNVGQDVMSATGSASDLLQNVPSVQVDVEGNVSLRGDTSVEILINGKPSTMMGRNRAAVLEQMAAGEIERVEVITNPSAKYKPEGTGGIINLVLKRERGLGFTGSTRFNVGNDERYNAGVSLSYNPGDYTVYGSASVRQEDRGRTGHESRTRHDAAGNLLSSSVQSSEEGSRPFSRIGQVGLDYTLGDNTKLGGAFSFNDRETQGRSRESNVTRDAAGNITRDYDRIRTGPEDEREMELELTFEHSFADDRDLRAELSLGEEKGDEHERYDNLSRVAGTPDSTDATARRATERDTDLSLDYTHPLAAGAKLELGYELEREKTDDDFRASTLDATTGAWIVDPQTTNRFVHDSAIHALYATYGRPFGKFGFLAGARYEHAFIETHQVTADLRNKNDYGRVYPSLHLSYHLTDTQQLQLSYSHRVNRPDGDDLNPFPRYDDPFDRQAGNPHLVPEDTHSVEGGYQYERDGVSYLVSLYVRQRYHGITDVTRAIDANTLLTTPENLATSRSEGLELGATRRIGDLVSLNFSGNVYRSEIDAANLGFAGRRATIAWDAKLNTHWNINERLVVQLTTGYTARRLTAQGARQPSAMTNLGVRYTLKSGRTSLVATVSDLFHSMRDETTLDTPILRGETFRQRSSQVVYLGVVYNFGRSAKKDREDLPFDDAL